MFHSTVNERKDKKSNKYSNHALRNGSSNGNGHSMQTERNILTAIQEMSSDATQSMKRRASEWKDNAAGYITKNRKKVRALRKSAKRQVKQNPKTALCIAAGIGLLMGVCLGRRSK